MTQKSFGAKTVSSALHYSKPEQIRDSSTGFKRDKQVFRRIAK